MIPENRESTENESREKYPLKSFRDFIEKSSRKSIYIMVLVIESPREWELKLTN